jgi:hypothetical protein
MGNHIRTVSEIQSSALKIFADIKLNLTIATITKMAIRHVLS